MDVFNGSMFLVAHHARDLNYEARDEGGHS